MYRNMLELLMHQLLKDKPNVL